MGNLKNKNLFLAGIQPGDYSNYSKQINDRMAEMYQRYGNTDYWQQFLNNPYLNLPSYFTKERVTTGNQDFWTDMYNQYEMNALTEIQRLYRLAYEEEYNHPINQTSREREAGINSDLAGNVSPGEAVEGTELPTPELPSMVDWRNQMVNRGSQLFSIGQDFISMFFQMAQNVQGLQSGTNQLAAQELTLLTGSDDYARNWRVNHADVLQPQNPDGPTDSIVSAIKQATDNMPLSRKSRKFVNRALGSYAGSSRLGVAGPVATQTAQYIKDRWSGASGLARPGWDNDSSKMVVKVAEKYEDIAFDVWKGQQNIQKQIIDFQTDYWSTMNDNQAGNTQGFVESQNLNNEAQYVSELGALGVPGERARSESRTLRIKKLSDDIQETNTRLIDNSNKELEALYNKYFSGNSRWQVIARLSFPFLKNLITQSITSYTQSAMQSLGVMSFSHKPVPPITYDFSHSGNTTTNTSILAPLIGQ